MKRILSFVLCICMIGALALSVSASVANENENLIEIVSKDLTTGNVSTSVIDCSPDTHPAARSVNNVHEGWFPDQGAAVANSIYSGVMGEDGRTKVSNTRNFPNSAICYIECYFGSNTYIGTAWMIGENIAVTSAHNIYDRNLSVAVDRVVVTPGKNEDSWFWSEPYGTTTVDKVKYPHEFATVNDSGPDWEIVAYDWAVLILNDAVGNDTGWFGFGWYVGDPTNETVTVCGYPGGTYGTEVGCQYTMTGAICAASATQLKYFIDVEQGQSGSPVYTNGISYGIASQYDPYTQKNLATRITHEIYVCLDRILEIEILAQEDL